MIKLYDYVSKTLKLYARLLTLLFMSVGSCYSYADNGDLTLMNLTNDTLYVGIYQYNHIRKFNTKVKRGVK